MILHLLRHMRPLYDAADKGGGGFGLPSEFPTATPAAAPGTTPIVDPAKAGQPAIPAPAASPEGPKAEPKIPETPPGTPPEPAKPDTPPDLNKPATPPEPAKPDAPPAGKTVDELEVELQDVKKRAAYHQTQHQRDKKELETLRKQYLRPPAPAPKETEKAKTPAIDPDELRKQLQDDPVAFLEHTKRVSKEAYQEALAEFQKMEREKADAGAFAQEKVDTVAAYHRMIFVTDAEGNLQANKEGKAVLVVPEKVLLQANEAVGAYGIDLSVLGGPTRYLQALMDHVNFLMSREADAVATTGKEAEMATKVKQNQLGVQPPPIGVVTPGEKTPEQKRLDNLAAQAPKGLNSLPA